MYIRSMKKRRCCGKRLMASYGSLRPHFENRLGRFHVSRSADESAEDIEQTQRVGTRAVVDELPQRPDQLLRRIVNSASHEVPEPLKLMLALVSGQQRQDIHPLQDAKQTARIADLIQL